MTSAQLALLVLVAEQLHRIERQNSGPDSQERRLKLGRALIAVRDEAKIEIEIEIEIEIKK